MHFHSCRDLTALATCKVTTMKDVCFLGSHMEGMLEWRLSWDLTAAEQRSAWDSPEMFDSFPEMGISTLLAVQDDK